MRCHKCKIEFDQIGIMTKYGYVCSDECKDSCESIQNSPHNVINNFDIENIYDGDDSIYDCGA